GEGRARTRGHVGERAGALHAGTGPEEGADGMGGRAHRGYGEVAVEDRGSRSGPPTPTRAAERGGGARVPSDARANPAPVARTDARELPGYGSYRLGAVGALHGGRVDGTRCGAGAGCGRADGGPGVGEGRHGSSRVVSF